MMKSIPNPISSAAKPVVAALRVPMVPAANPKARIKPAPSGSNAYITRPIRRNAIRNSSSTPTIEVTALVMTSRKT